MNLLQQTSELLHVVNEAEFHGIITLKERDKKAKQIEKLLKELQGIKNKTAFKKDSQ